jgi:hypothetical protein
MRKPAKRTKAKSAAAKSSRPKSRSRVRRARLIYGEEPNADRNESGCKTSNPEKQIEDQGYREGISEGGDSGRRSGCGTIRRLAS